tara:strand:+ start:130 stop:417 length:288 start_codon:yes stop_codon:yes gene_type:complete
MTIFSSEELSKMSLSAGLGDNVQQMSRFIKEFNGSRFRHENHLWMMKLERGALMFFLAKASSYQSAGFRMWEHKAMESVATLMSAQKLLVEWEII